MNQNIAVFSTVPVEEKILQSLQNEYTNVFFSHFSGALDHLSDYPYIHYWYIQNKKNVDIAVIDLFDIEKLMVDKHRLFYIYDKNTKNTLNLYQKFIYGFIAAENQKIFLDVFNKPCIYY